MIGLGGKVRLGMLAILLAGMAAFAVPAWAASGLQVFTPYTSLSLPPGETVTYSVDLINNTADIRTANLAFDDAGRQWTYDLTADGHAVRQVAVKPKESVTVNLSLTVPLQVEKGDYSFKLNAGDFGTLPLQVAVTEKGSYKSELTSAQPNRQGAADSSFTYSLTLDNRTASKQQYAFSAEPPAGWDASFSVDGTNVTSVDIDAAGSKSITLNVKPADKAQAGSFKIPVHASSGNSTADLEVEAVITGTYGLELKTADERLSADVTAGHTRSLELKVTNTGSAELTDVSLTSQPPADWEVTFEPKSIAKLAAGQSVPVTATIKASSKALAGDYVANLSAQSAQKTADAAIRFTVKTSALWGWIGALIIVAVCAGVYGLFRKYGRR